MQDVLTYLLKSSGLIMMFFLAYHFLLRKETFFTTNRWFLLTGLITSLVLPLFFITKIIVIHPAKAIAIPIKTTAATYTQPIAEAATKTVEIDWLQLTLYGYGCIVALLLLKVIWNLISLVKVLKNKSISNENSVPFIDIQENLSPFSFFNYIVINSSLYSEKELQSILLHEKIHSAQKHSFDVLVTNLFAVIFWFNPFMYFYKKSVIQNLEYIADSEAIAQIDDKKSYQMALLKVVSHQNCLPITNHFYQSLIKKRIVMLNKNQSKRKNLWKYSAILPALVVFVLLFQINVIAQEKATRKSNKTIMRDTALQITIDKNSTDESLKEMAENLKSESGITVNFSKIKRNAAGEITAIKIDYKDKNGHKGTSVVNGDEPIDAITIFKSKNSVGILSRDAEPRSHRMATTTDDSSDENSDENSEKTYMATDELNEDFIAPPSPPSPPAPPAPPVIKIDMAGFPAMPQAPTAPKGSPLTNEKEWKKFEKQMDEFEKKMEAIQPEIDAYAEKMANIDEQMEPFNKEMEIFEKKMEIFEKQMEEYQSKMDAEREIKRSKKM